MKTARNSSGPAMRGVALLVVIAAAGLGWIIFRQSGSLNGQPSVPPARESTAIFTPAHRSFGEAVRHFFGIRPEAEQPIAYTHQVHIEKAELECVFCHSTVDRGPKATIPNVQECMVCHQAIATDRPAIQMLTEYYNRGEEIPWQRVYGWNEEAHVRFNHAPHIRAQVECATCHGDVARMTTAQRVVDHSMGFCVNCHEQRQASNDCLTCHY